MTTAGHVVAGLDLTRFGRGKARPVSVSVSAVAPSDVPYPTSVADLDDETVRDHFVKVAAHEDTHGPIAKGVVTQADDLDSIHYQGELIPECPN